MILDHTYTGWAHRVTGRDPKGEVIAGAFRVLSRIEDGSVLVGNGEDPESVWCIGPNQAHKLEVKCCVTPCPMNCPCPCHSERRA